MSDNPKDVTSTEERESELRDDDICRIEQTFASIRSCSRIDKKGEDGRNLASRK